MENKKNTVINSVPKVLFVAIICVIVDVIHDRFGTYSFFSKGGNYHNMEMMGIIIPLIVLFLPVFAKDLRAKMWSKKNLMLTFVVLIISIILIAIIYANKYYYRSYWFDIGLFNRERSLAPPIRWDIWNIIDKQYPE